MNYLFLWGCEEIHAGGPNKPSRHRTWLLPAGWVTITRQAQVALARGLHGKCFKVSLCPTSPFLVLLEAMVSEKLTGICRF